MNPPRYVTILLIPDGGEHQRGFKVRRWVLNLTLVSFASLVIGIVMFFAFFGTMAARAIKTEQLAAENEQLKRYRHKVVLLEENLREVGAVVSRLTKLAGIEYQMPTLPPDSELFASLADTGKRFDMTQRRSEDLLPIGLPIKGPVVRFFASSDAGSPYPGVDIACTPGMPVVATAGGKVMYTGGDERYGTIVVVSHNDSISTVYGYLDQVRVTGGAVLQVGDTIALTPAATGAESPVIYYEVRRNDQPINPLENLYAKETE